MKIRDVVLATVLIVTRAYATSVLAALGAVLGVIATALFTGHPTAGEVRTLNQVWQLGFVVTLLVALLALWVERMDDHGRMEEMGELKEGIDALTSQVQALTEQLRGERGRRHWWSRR